MESKVFKIFVFSFLIAVVAFITNREPDETVTSAVQQNTVFNPMREAGDEENCAAISELDRSQLIDESGYDLAAFVEQSVREMHAARGVENQLRVVAGRFDSFRWSHTLAVPNADLAPSLNYGALFLSRYHRVLENGLRQEESALRAFRWQPDVRREIREAPLRAMVRSYSPYVCSGDDHLHYGCDRGETLYRLKTLLSPHIACRFPEKRSQYTADFWVRVSRGERQGGGRNDSQSGSVAVPRILEVEVNGERLVKSTSDDFEHRQLLSALAPDVKEALHSIGLDPLRARILWKHWQSHDDRKPASK